VSVYCNNPVPSVEESDIWRRGLELQLPRWTMASIKIDDLTSVKPFDPHSEPSGVGRRWQRRFKSFSVYADSKGLLIQADKADNKTQRRALLLHSAGEGGYFLNVG